MSQPLKDYDAIKRERREFEKKLKELLEKEEELKRHEKQGEDLVVRSGILRELERIAAAIRECRRRIEDAQVLIAGRNPHDQYVGSEGSRDDEATARMEVANAKAELERLLEEQRKEIGRLAEIVTVLGEKTTVSPDDEAALRKAIEDAKTCIGDEGAAIQRLKKDLERIKRELKVHGEKGELPKCGAQCKFPEHGLCDNPAVRNGRCWIPDHQAQ